MLPRPAWVIFASDPLSAIGVNQTCGGPRAQNPLHRFEVDFCAIKTDAPVLWSGEAVPANLIL